MEVTVGEKDHKVNYLVDTGAELYISSVIEAIKEFLSIKAFNIRIKGIERNSTAIVELSENTLQFLLFCDERRIHFFIARGPVHTVIGLSFLSDNSTGLEPLQSQGELLSHKEPHGRTFSILICSPEEKGWDTAPNRGVETFNMATITEMKHKFLISISFKVH
ncbi:hypothetical protein O181_007699 [Austropuccinia psidii MF-1]|uniref:Peptidase A2 domain-containing protein n=1 Tax=Austropuccinia psidii MF-1 TaxID=1389203 RepID=A0A9Q3BLD2_9BASI|nr:hypothetical protein [Austropuccinia psidii MF-1]